MRYRCSGLKMQFATRQGVVEVLDGVDLETREGEFLSVLGPSGCGKTTLLRILAGLLRPTAGQVDRIAPAGSENNHRALVVFQDKALFPWLTVLENATFGLRMQGAGKAEREEPARELLRRFGLNGRERAYPGQLSVGMRQRVSLIRSFTSRPSALLMDEPFAAVDYQTRLVLQQELLDLWSQNRTSVLFVTHDIEEAILLSDRVLMMSPQPSRVLSSLPVTLPRPRFAALTAHEAFTELKLKILEDLRLSAPAPVAAGMGQ